MTNKFLKSAPQKNKHNYPKVILLLVCLLTLPGFILGCSDEGKTKLKMATGGTSGTYYALGGAMAQVLQEAMDNVSFSVQATGASKANILLLANKEVDLAIVQNDVMSYAYEGTEFFAGKPIQDFVAIGTLYPEVCQVVVSGDSGISSLADLKGKRVSIGDAGSGVEANAKQILGAYGITTKDIIVQNLSFGDSANAIKDKKIDAFFCTAGIPTTAVMELAGTTNVKIIGPEQAYRQKLIAEYPFYTEFIIPKDAYKGMTEEVTTLAVRATLIVSKDMSEDLAYALTKALYEQQEAIGNAHAKGKEISLKESVLGIDITIHPGAVRYFKEMGIMK